MTFKTQTIYSENEGAELLKNELRKILDEQLFSAGIDPVMTDLGVTSMAVETRDGKFTTMLGVNELESIGELDELPLINKEQGYEKGYLLQRYGGTIAISKPLRKWIETYVSGSDITMSTKMEIKKLVRDVERLATAAKITKNNQITRILTNGHVATQAFNDGSASPDGLSLFNASHVIKSTGATQSNLATGVLSNDATGKANLLAAIALLRNMKDNIGRKMRRSSSYKLIVPSEQEGTVRELLNNGSNFSGEGSNSNELNIFAWEGFRVELMVLDTLNQPDNAGGVVGDALQWFLLDMDRAKEMEAFRELTLYNEEFDMYEDPKTKVLFVDVDLYSTVEHYQYECIAGSTWI